MLSVISARPKEHSDRWHKPTYDELLEEVTRLRELLEPKDLKWRHALGITNTDARLLWLLVQREIVPHEALSNALFHDRDWFDGDFVSAIRCRISFLRTKLGKRFVFTRDLIKAINGVGYKMDPEYRTLLRKEIQKVGET